MTEVRCPFCGNPNAANAEVCVVCGSRLQAVQNSSSAEPAGPDDTPDWLANLRRRAQNETDEPESSAAFTSIDGLEEGETEDWLQSLKQAAAAMSEDDFAETVETGPFENPRPVDSRPAGSPFSAGSDQSDDQSWLRELADLPSDGLEDFDTDEDDQAPFAGPVDWARRLASEPIAQQPAEEPDESDDIPDAEENGELLSRLQSWTSQPPLESTEAKSSAGPEMPTPAFTLDDEEPAAAEPEAETEKPIAGEGWPQDFSIDEQPAPAPFLEPVNAKESADAAVESAAEPVSEPGDLPDWMQDLPSFEPAPDETSEEQPTLEAPAQNQAFLEVPEDLVPVETGDSAVSLPDEEPEQPAAEAFFEDEADEALFESSPFALDEVPDWLAAYSSDEVEIPPEPPEEADQEAQAAPFAPVVPEELTDRAELQGAEPSPEADGNAESKSEEAAAEPVLAQLPGWVEAMRPVESVLSTDEVRQESNQRIERSGPLAGIPGAIPGEDLATRYFKPPVYSSKLQVTEKQRLHANLLEAMISETDEPAMPGSERKARPSVLPRLLVAVVLLAVLSYVWISGISLFSPPNLYPAEAAAFQRTLQAAIESQQPVLVVVDYQPAFTAELETAASGALQTLAESGAGLAFLSTSPTGPVLSSRLIENMAAVSPGFTPAEDAINLGYLAGGNTGMQAFTIRPSLAVLSTFEGDDAWGSPMLSGIQNLDGFGALLVLTDTVENGRDWIEQVQPSLVNTPMLMVASAQSAPLLQPYVQSGQLGGLLSGWYGGVSYDRITNRPATTEPFAWSAYQVGIALIVVLILAGALIQGMMTLFSARNNESGA